VAIGCAQKDLETAPESVGETAVDESTGTLSIFTVNYPLAYFAERIGGDLVTVTFPAPAGVDPAYWAPGPEQVAEYQQADLILLNGLGYAKWLQRATLPAGKLVDTSRSFEDRWVPLQGGAVHSHGLEGEHSHQGYAFTTWLDPLLAIEQAKSVAEALREALPEHDEILQSSLEALVTDLQQLDNALVSATDGIGGQLLLFSHPVYQYLVSRYGLNARSVHWEPNEEPNEEQWQELQTMVAKNAAQWMIWEGQPTTATAGRLAELGIQSTVYAPCANRPSEGDLLAVMHLNVASLQEISAQK
jgi:zinc transport system substrate-binding protein